MNSMTVRRTVRGLRPALLVLLTLVATATALGLWLRDGNGFAALGWGIVAAFWLRELAQSVQPTTSPAPAVALDAHTS